MWFFATFFFFFFFFFWVWGEKRGRGCVCINGRILVFVYKEVEKGRREGGFIWKEGGGYMEREGGMKKGNKTYKKPLFLLGSVLSRT